MPSTVGTTFRPRYLLFGHMDPGLGRPEDSIKDLLGAQLLRV